MRINTYIKCVLNEKNEFRTYAEFTLFGILIQCDDLKIDTGCGYTSFPVKRLGIFTDDVIIEHKKQDIINKVHFRRAYGVETSGTKHKKLNTLQDMIFCEALNFRKDIQNFSICGVKIDIDNIFVNYDRRGNKLLGMDIMKDWDIHIGTIDNPDLPEYGQTIFLGCPRNQINNDYLLELERLFGIITSMEI